jgi:lysyl-tRNA synthetase class I
MDAERFIETLKREQAQLALASLRTPNSRDSFEFGLVCGLVQAYDRMLTILQEQQDEAEGKPRQQHQRPVMRSNPYLTELDNAPMLPEQYGRRK